MEAIEDKIRLDKWLWYARFFKSRTLASKVCETGRIRVNSQAVSKAKTTVKSGDVITFPQERDVRVIKILDIGARRGPAAEAQGLYEDLAPIEQKTKEDRVSELTVKIAVRESGSGRPTKKERREMDQFISVDE
jgi:ribosome-associated heat shock protein Hsp15